MWRPEGWENPQVEIIHKISDSLLEKPSLERQNQLRLHQCESLAFERGADAMLEALKNDDTASKVNIPNMPKGTLVFIPDEN